MNHKRRKFVKNVGLTFMAIPFTSNLAFSSNINSLSKNTSLFKEIEQKGFEVLAEESFMLNESCRATPLQKQTFLYGTEKGLLVEMDNSTHFILNEKQLEAYNNFISNFSENLNDEILQNCIKPDLAKATTPVKILKSNSSNDFRFQNAAGNTIEVFTRKKQTFVKVA